jgi:hypothetical protein
MPDADDLLGDWTAFTLINWAPYPPELMTACSARGVRWVRRSA